jgi:hypothetical protein
MSSNYSLTLVNPAVATKPPSVLYTGVDGGNTLNLIIGNDFGFDVQIGGGSLGPYLVVQFSSNIMDADSAAQLSAAAPWTVQSYAAPGTFNLRPPSGGVTLPNGGTITVTLTGVRPSGTGVGLVTVAYQFDTTAGDNLNVSASVSSMASPDANKPSLIGDNDALRLTTYVNGGSLSNPIMVSAAPATTDTAVDNQVHVNLLFQQATSPQARLTSGASGLVDGWDPVHPPSIRVFFPYFTAGQLPAVLDLTDALKAGDAHYNPLTSAWNIRGSLDPANPDITSDTFWQIGLDLLASVPVWLITPTPANTNLFTAIESSSTQPGPFLDCYLLAIVSALEIDRRNPETIFYVQWNDVPGFNDGLAAYPLQKTTLAIRSFEIGVQRGGETPQLVAQWSTTGAAYCRLSGDSHLLWPNTGDDPYSHGLTLDRPMRSSYTLTAIAADNVTQVSRTRVARWSYNTALAGTPINLAQDLGITRDGRTVLVIGGPDGDHIGVFFCDGETLQARSLTPLLAAGHAIKGFTVTPGGRVMFVVTDDRYAVYGYDLQTLETTPGSGATYAKTTQGVPFLAVSADGTVLVQVEPAIGEGDSGPGTMVVLTANVLAPIPASPVELPQAILAMAVGRKTGRYYMGTLTALSVVDPQTYQPVLQTDTVPVTSVNLSADERVVFLTTLDTIGKVATLARVDAATGTVKIQLATALAVVPFLQFGGSAASPDGATLFVCGVDMNASTSKLAVTALKAYEGTTLEELPWSPVSFDGLYPIQIILSPDGSRLFATVAPVINLDPATALVAVDPTFA